MSFLDSVAVVCAPSRFGGRSSGDFRGVHPGAASMAAREGRKCAICEEDVVVFCEIDDAYLCVKCDVIVHEVNSVSRRHSWRTMPVSIQGKMRSTGPLIDAVGVGWGALAVREDSGPPPKHDGVWQGTAQKGCAENQSKGVEDLGAHWPSLKADNTNCHQGDGDYAAKGRLSREVNRNKPISSWEISQIQKQRKKLGEEIKMLLFQS